MESSEINYKLLSSEAEASRAKWEQETENSLQSFQTLEETRVDVARNSLWKVSNLISSSCVGLDNGQEQLRTKLERVHINETIQEIIDETSSGQRRPKEIWYESFPNSSHYGLGPAPNVILESTPNSTLRREARAVQSSPSPPKPPRLIHYLPSWQTRSEHLETNNTTFPFVGRK